MKLEFNDLGEITDVTSFVRQIESLAKKRANRPIWFRGQENKSHRLLPEIGRKYSYAGATDCLIASESDIFNRFKRHSVAFTGKLLKDWEVLCLARHHGLPTRFG